MSFVTTSDFFEGPGQMKKNQTGIFDCIHHIPPDLAPSDYHLFRSLEHFESLQHMKKKRVASNFWIKNSQHFFKKKSWIWLKGGEMLLRKMVNIKLT